MYSLHEPDVDCHAACITSNFLFPEHSVLRIHPIFLITWTNCLLLSFGWHIVCLCISSNFWFIACQCQLMCSGLQFKPQRVLIWGLVESKLLIWKLAFDNWSVVILPYTSVFDLVVKLAFVLFHSKIAWKIRCFEENACAFKSNFDFQEKFEIYTMIPKLGSSIHGKPNHFIKTHELTSITFIPNLFNCKQIKKLSIVSNLSWHKAENESNCIAWAIKCSWHWLWIWP